MRRLNHPDLPSFEYRTTQRRYDRIASLYDVLEAPVERFRFSSWRSRLRGKIAGTRALEVGVGTGKNFPFYPHGITVIGVDLSPRMLDHARRKAPRLGLDVALLEMDVQWLGFPESCFDTVFATFVFCSVPDPVRGLAELRRVCRPNGKLLLLEHVRPSNPHLGLLFDFLNPAAVRMTGANINRRTEENLRKAGWRLQRVEPLSGDIVKWIEAAP